jgi:hypothetical protein
VGWFLRDDLILEQDYDKLGYVSLGRYVQGRQDTLRVITLKALGEPIRDDSAASMHLCSVQNHETAQHKHHCKCQNVVVDQSIQLGM